jgi:hypothetical protein
MSTNQRVFRLYVASTPIDFRKGPTPITISTISLATVRELHRSASRPRERRDHPRGQRLASQRKQLRWIKPVRARDRWHVRPWRKRFAGDPIFLVLRPDARANRKPLSCSRDNLEIVGVGHMFAHMNS